MADLVGIATWNFGEGSLAERIDRFAGMGYNAVSLIARDARALCTGQTPEVEEALARHSLPVAIHTGLAPTGEPVQAEALLADFELFTAWHARTGALVTINYDAAKLKVGDGWEYQTEAMVGVVGEMLRISDGAGFRVGVEDWPLNAEQLHEAEELRAYPHYGMLIDLGHLNFRVRKSIDYFDSPFPIEAVKEHLDRMELPVNELHVHNNDGKRDLHAPPTTGTADLAAVAALLKAKGVQCISTIELVPAWCGLTEEQGWLAAREALGFWRGVF
jgi:sugar phosphate isomerase/epimerase